MQSSTGEKMREEIGEIFTNDKSNKYVILPLHEAMELTNFKTETLQFISGLRLTEKLDEPDSNFKDNSIYHLCIFRKKAFKSFGDSVFGSDDPIECIGENFFSPIMISPNDILKLHFCLSESNSYIFVLMIGLGASAELSMKKGKARRIIDDSPWRSGQGPWKIVGGSVLMPLTCGIYLEYIGVTDAKFSYHNFYHPDRKLFSLGKKTCPREFHCRALRYKSEKNPGSGIGSLIIKFIAAVLPKTDNELSIFCQVNPEMNRDAYNFFVKKLKFKKIKGLPTYAAEKIIHLDGFRFLRILLKRSTNQSLKQGESSLVDHSSCKSSRLQMVHDYFQQRKGKAFKLFEMKSEGGAKVYLESESEYPPWKENVSIPCKERKMVYTIGPCYIPEEILDEISKFEDSTGSEVLFGECVWNRLIDPIMVAKVIDPFSELLNQRIFPSINSSPTYFDMCTLRHNSYISSACLNWYLCYLNGVVFLEKEKGGDWHFVFIDSTSFKALFAEVCTFDGDEPTEGQSNISFRILTQVNVPEYRTLKLKDWIKPKMTIFCLVEKTTQDNEFFLLKCTIPDFEQNEEELVVEIIDPLLNDRTPHPVQLKYACALQKYLHLFLRGCKSRLYKTDGFLFSDDDERYNSGIHCIRVLHCFIFHQKHGVSLEDKENGEALANYFNNLNVYRARKLLLIRILSSCPSSYLHDFLREDITSEDHKILFNNTTNTSVNCRAEIGTELIQLIPNGFYGSRRFSKLKEIIQIANNNILNLPNRNIVSNDSPLMNGSRKLEEQLSGRKFIRNIKDKYTDKQISMKSNFQGDDEEFRQVFWDEEVNQSIIEINDLGEGTRENEGSCAFLCLSHALFGTHLYYEDIRRYMYFIFKAVSVMDPSAQIFNHQEAQNLAWGSKEPQGEEEEELRDVFIFLNSLLTVPERLMQHQREEIVKQNGLIVYDEEGQIIEDGKTAVQLCSVLADMQLDYTIWGSEFEIALFCSIFNIKIRLLQVTTSSKKSKKTKLREWKGDVNSQTFAHLPIIRNMFKDVFVNELVVYWASTSNSEHFVLISPNKQYEQDPTHKLTDDDACMPLKTLIETQMEMGSAVQQDNQIQNEMVHVDDSCEQIPSLTETKKYISSLEQQTHFDDTCVSAKSSSTNMEVDCIASLNQLKELILTDSEPIEHSCQISKIMIEPQLIKMQPVGNPCEHANTSNQLLKAVASLSLQNNQNHTHCEPVDDNGNQKSQGLRHNLTVHLRTK